MHSSPGNSSDMIPGYKLLLGTIPILYVCTVLCTTVAQVTCPLPSSPRRNALPMLPVDKSASVVCSSIYGLTSTATCLYTVINRCVTYTVLRIELSAGHCLSSKSPISSVKPLLTRKNHLLLPISAAQRITLHEGEQGRKKKLAPVTRLRV